MIEERARVIDIGDGYVWVETQRQSACGACHASCDTAFWNRLWRRPPPRVYALSDLPLQVGDEVVVGIAENALVQGSLVVYGVPLLAMFAGTLLGRLATTSEGTGILLGLGGLAAGFAWVRYGLTPKLRGDGRFQPIVLRRFAAATGNSV